MVFVDGTGTILFANHQVTALFGYAPEEVVGQRVESLLPERFRDRHPGHRERFAADERVRPMGAGLELFARRRDGTEFPVEISLSPVRDGTRALVVAAIRDVTDRKRIQAELVAAREAADHAGKSRTTRAKSPTARTRARAGSSPPPAMICASPCRRWRCSTARCAGSFRRATAWTRWLSRNRPSVRCRACSMRCSTSASSNPERSSRRSAISGSPHCSRSCALSSRDSRPTRAWSCRSRRARTARTATPPWSSRFCATCSPMRSSTRRRAS